MDDEIEPENTDVDAGVEADAAADVSKSEEGDSESQESSAHAPMGEMVDRNEIKARKVAEKKKKKTEARLRAQDEITVALQEGYLGSKKKKRVKKSIKWIFWALSLVVLYFLYGFLFTSAKAGVRYGLCKAYLEQSIRFPLYLKYISLSPFEDSVRVWFKRIDSFGSHRMESIRCYYKYDEAIGRSIMDKVVIERREEPEYKVERFNTVLPVILQNLPDLTWPQWKNDKDLRNLNLDRKTRFRRGVL